MLIKHYNRWGDIFFAGVALFVMLAILFSGRNVGLSDQGDFIRVINASSLTNFYGARPFEFVGRYTIVLDDAPLASNIMRIMFSSDGFWDYPSVHLLPVRLSVVANLALNFVTGADLTIYRIEILGAMTAVLYAGLFFWLFRQIRLKNIAADAAAKALIIFVACDIGYIAYFNSFYSESVQILAFMFMVIAGLRILGGKTRVPDYALLVAAATVYGWSKFANLPIAALVIAAFGVVVAISPGRQGDGSSVLRGSCKTEEPSPCLPAKLGVLAVASVSLLLFIYSRVPDWMYIDTNFNSVFFGVVKDVDDATARERLQALGLNPEMAYFASQHRYVAGVQAEFAHRGFEDELAQLSKFDLLWFYARRPALFAEGVSMRIAHSGQIRPWSLANYGAFMEQSTRFSGWSWLRVRMAFDTVWGNIALWAAFAGGVFAMFRANRKKGLPMLLMFAGVFGAGVYALSVQLVANGEADIGKQMFMYIQIADLLFVAVVIAGLARLRFSTRIAAACAAVLALPMAGLAWYHAAPVRPVELEAAAVGDIVSFGRFREQELLWLVVDETENSRILMAAENIAYKPFDGAGGNFWAEADIRDWLNGEFKRETFEHGSIMQQSRYLLLTTQTKQHATQGDRDFFAYHIPRYAFRGVERSYRKPVSDYVRLPCVDIMQRLQEMNRPVRGGYWLEIPRFLCGALMRYVSRDGFIHLRAAGAEAGVRPVIEVGF